MAEERINWHSAFYDAIRLELEDYIDSLIFDTEYQLTTDPLIIDVLIIKKIKDVVIEKNIARIFRATNIIEYKSPEDYLSVQDFHKALAYTHLYCAISKDTSIEDVTLSFVLTRKPREVIKHVKETCKCTVTNTGEGIYYVKGAIIPIQIIETKLLSEEDNLWLKDLRGDLSTPEFSRVLEASHPRAKLEYIRAYLHALINANKTSMEELKMKQKESLTTVLKRMGYIDEWEARGEARGVARGVALGEALGEARGLRFTATNLKRSGMSLKQIAEVTGLPIDEINQL
ncbi:MAG: hypothetical protein Ta2G_02170 [Termitinemataceae bacterium]|nr:MAG: hypothetical protein Ta2G_02170 [Termitinemataceae bacterium]